MLALSDRFERLPPHAAGGCKMCNRDGVNPRLPPEQLLRPGEFLARLWARFGPAERSDDGFSYSVRDRQTGLSFEAYSGASGPAYGAEPEHHSQLRPVLEAFERWLDATTPVDCTMETESDFGPFRYGFRDGAAFEESIPLGPDPKTARSVAQCHELVTQYARGDVVRGWTYAFERVLDAPEELVVKGRQAHFLGIGPATDGVAAFFEDGDSPWDVPIDEVAWLRSAALDLWLEAYRSRPRKRKRKRS